MNAFRPKTPRSFLFVPANRPERFVKAQNSGADAIIVDLEDTIAPKQKSEARSAVVAFDKVCVQPFWVRINNDDNGALDIASLSQCKNLSGVVVPKVVNTSVLEEAFKVLGVPTIAVIETAGGLLELSNIVRARGLLALSFGVLDLAGSLGVSLGTQGARDIFCQVRSQLVVHSSAHGLARPIETIFANFDDEMALVTAATYAYQMGFGGQLAIHPKQVEVINRAYQPNETELVFARAILAHYEKTGELAFGLDGVMVDLPLIDWAKRVCA